MKKIVFFLPVLGRNVPIGGFKVVYEYANRFAEDNYKVIVVYAASYNRNVYYNIKALFIVIFNILRGYSGRKWFPLNQCIKEKILPCYVKWLIPNADSYVATSYTTAVELNKLNIRNKNKIYFIQDYEVWGRTDEDVQSTYCYGMNNIVISNDLKKKLSEVGAESVIIPNGFDFTKFKLINPIIERNKYHISMLFHKMERKGCKYGIEALKIVKEKYPELKITFFGTPPQPSDLPFEIEYYQKPDEATHRSINNQAAIFIAPSIYEGWGLTVGEAMACGQAVVCTDNGGHREIAKNGVNALLCPIKNSNDIANKIIMLIEDDKLRYKIADNGYKFVQQYTWDKSYRKFKSIVDKTL